MPCAHSGRSPCGQHQRQPLYRPRNPLQRRHTPQDQANLLRLSSRSHQTTQRHGPRASARARMRTRRPALSRRASSSSRTLSVRWSSSTRSPCGSSMGGKLSATGVCSRLYFGVVHDLRSDECFVPWLGMGPLGHPKVFINLVCRCHSYDKFLVANAIKGQTWPQALRVCYLSYCAHCADIGIPAHLLSHSSIRPRSFISFYSQSYW